MPSGISITIEVQQDGLLLKNPKKYGEKMCEKMNKVLIASGRYILAEIIKETPVGATGGLRREWQMKVEYEHTPLGQSAVVTIHNPLLHLEPVNLGRKAAPISKQGMDSLRLWVTRKLGVALAESKSVAFAIARSKAKKATPGQHFVENTLERVIPFISKRIAQDFEQELSDIPESG